MCQILIVDNSVCSFGLQLDNGIPIVPYYFDGDDRELVLVAAYVLGLANIRDMREVNKETFKLRKLLESDLQTYLS
jgi:CTD small phosphatase-like protein 2